MAIVRNPFISPEKALTSIDIILNHLKNLNRWLEISNINPALEIAGIELLTPEIETILDKLVKDGYAIYSDTSFTYKITFEGLLFKGYKNEIDLNQQSLDTRLEEKKAARKYEKRLLFAYWAAAIAGFLLCALQILIYLRPPMQGMPYHP